MQVWGIFPPEWHLPQLVCLAFCTITKSHLAEILDAKVIYNIRIQLRTYIRHQCCATLASIIPRTCLRPAPDGAAARRPATLG
jgi:hypothetical protein